MFSVLRGDGARLLRSLALFALDLNRDRYEEILPPHYVRGEIMVGTGHLPKFEEEAYRLRDDDLWAIPTGEVPLMGLHRGEILPEAELPKRYMTYTVCWRREAGAAGKDTRGLQRLHEFHKVELLKLCLPEQAQEEFETLLADAERPLRLLGLPYRVVDLCTADLTFASARVQDLEVYSPGLDRWLDINAFAAAPLGTWGDCGVGIARAPGYHNIDAVLSKRFDVGGQRYLELRAEAFNLTNTPSFAAPGSDIADVNTFGRITNTVSPPRNVELVVKFSF